MTSFPLLSSPVRVGPLTLRNRVVFSAHLTNAAVDGMPSRQHEAYYAARAAGGAGLIVTEEHTVHPSDRPYEKVIQGHRHEVLAGYRALTDAVHAHDTPVLAQIGHNGPQGTGLYTRRPLWAPSAVPDPMFREVPHAIDTTEIGELVSSFARVAERCRRGGFDGVEVQCSQSSLIRAFLAPSHNLRTDRYGGSLENRARFLTEVLAAVREALGPSLVLGVRLSGDDLVADGIGTEEAVLLAGMLDGGGRLDYLNTTVGTATSTLYQVEASMAAPRGYGLYVSDAIRRRVSLPVVGAGRLNDPAVAERALAEGRCDLVSVVRGQIADPEFAAKATGGREETIVPCLSCNQECIGRVGMNRTIACVVNPAAGRESVDLPVPRRRVRRRVLVVGAGVAGLQAAVDAAGRGHEVTVLEQAAQAGGQVRLAACAPHRGELIDLVDSLERRCADSGVEIRFGTRADPDVVRQAGVDAVVVATGAEPGRPPWASGPHVVDVRHVLDGTARPRGEVLVVDESGFHPATSVAELLARQGCAVTVCTSAAVVGQDLGLTLDLERWTARVHDLGVETVTEVVPVQCRPGGRNRPAGSRQVVVLAHYPTGTRREYAVDWVVVAAAQQPVDALWKQLQGERFDVHRIGDAVAPRRIDSAIREGARIAALL